MVPGHSPEHFLLRCIVPRRVICHFFSDLRKRGEKGSEIKPSLAACTPPLYVLEYIRHARSIP